MSELNRMARMQAEIERHDRIAVAWYELGVQDALHSTLPRWQDSAYLAGYVAGVQQLPADAAGQIALPAVAEPTDAEF